MRVIGQTHNDQRIGMETRIEEEALLQIRGPHRYSFYINYYVEQLEPVKVLLLGLYAD